MYDYNKTYIVNLGVGLTRSNAITASSVVLLLGLTGCAPHFIEPKDLSHAVLVERQFVVESPFLQPSQRRELVQTRQPGVRPLSIERVRWIKGLDANSLRLQRATERHTGEQQSGSIEKTPSSAVNTGLVQAVFFDVHNGRLSVEGELSLNSFQGKNNARYFVEFLYRGPMNEVEAHEMTAVWGELSGHLARRGVDPKKIIMGGSKYHQRVNAIALLRVGEDD